MKQLIILLIILISISAVSAITPWNEVVQEGEEYPTTIGSLYLLQPTDVIQGEEAVVSVLIVLNSSQIDGNLRLEGAPSTYEFEAGDTFENDSYFQQEWLVDISNFDTTMNLVLEINEKIIFEKEFLIEAKRIIEEEVIDYRFVTVEEGNKEEVRGFLEQKGRKFSALEFDQAVNKANEQVQINKEIIIKEITFDDRTTRIKSSVVLTIKPLNVENPIDVVELIPKEIAENVKELEFSPKPIVLQEDPVIMWHLENLDEDTQLEYEVKGNLSLTGNTVLVAQTVNEDIKGKSFPWRIVAPLLIIPIIGIIIIYFARFEPKK